MTSLTKTELLSLSRADFKALPLKDRLIYLGDPYLFMKHCCFTRDEVDALAPVKPAPLWPEQEYYKPYILPATRAWQRLAHTTGIVYDKSRRMWISYLILCLHLHAAFRKTDRRIGVITEKHEKSCAHLDNMVRIYKNIPDDVYPQDTRPTVRTKEGLIAFDEIESYVHGVASGPDQVRQFGFSNIFWDEIDFCERQDETWAALVPTISGGGSFTGASTHKLVDTGVESFYQRLVEDRL